MSLNIWNFITKNKIPRRIFGEKFLCLMLHFRYTFNYFRKLHSFVVGRVGQDFIYTVSYFGNHQVVFGVHSDINHLHTHFMVNNVSFRDGSALKSKGEIKLDLEILCSTVLSDFGK